MSLKKIVPVLLIGFLFSPIYGQKEFRKADKLLSLKAFDLAIKNYESALAKYPDNAEGYANLGEAYQMTNQLLPALKSYERAFELSTEIDGKYKLLYAHTLKKVGLYEKAEAWYEKYMTVNAAEASYFISSTDFAKSQLQKPDQYDVLSFEGNSAESDFGPAILGDKLVFSSFREDLPRNVDKKNDSYINKRGNQLFITNLENPVGARIDFLRPDQKEIFNLGPVSYSRDGQMMAYTRNTFTSGSNQIFSDEMDMSIYLAKTDKSGDFYSPEPFEYNHVEYSCAFPNLSYNGKAMYFASNKPGGFGGFDIYVSYIKQGKWSKPENLGENINSKGNEISPFFDGENLYFASDYRMGLGGFDNFIAKVVEGQWAVAENMGKGINSPSDDYYLITNDTGEKYYFTSNRLGGRGKDDIYIAYPMRENADQLAYEDAPLAVNLDELTQRNAELAMEDVTAMSESGENMKTGEVVQVSDTETMTVLADPAETDEGTTFADKVSIEDLYFDFEGARLSSVKGKDPDVDLDDSKEVFFVQLASLSKSEGKLGYYSEIIAYGRLYRFFKTNSVKIRLGFYNSKQEAESVLTKVKTAGFKDAFVTADVLSVSEFELIKEAPGSTRESFINEYSASSQYKVKLASYLNPMGFDVEAAGGIGRIEMWSKGKWTIFVLGGYDSYESAEKGRIMAVNRGFGDAELVLDDGGILRRVKSK